MTAKLNVTVRIVHSVCGPEVLLKQRKTYQSIKLFGVTSQTTSVIFIFSTLTTSHMTAISEQ